jgi:hypothetical protein
LRLRGDFELGLLRNPGTVEILKTLGDGLNNVFCIMRSMGAFGVQGQNVMV